MSFASPLILAGLLVLPLIVWLLRVMPPQPVKRVFGGMFFLERIDSAKTQPVRTPPWILILRVLAFAALVIGFAGPNVGQPIERRDGDLLLVINNGWDAAQHWEQSLEAARQAIAETDGTTRIMTMSDRVVSPPLSRRAAEEALKTVNVAPALVDWEDLPREAADLGDRTIVITSAALREDASIAPVGSADAFFVPEANVSALGTPKITGEAISVPLYRTQTDVPRTYSVRALSQDGRTVATQDLELSVGQAGAEVTFRLPLILRNDVSRLSIDGIRSAGAVALLGSSARRTLAGLISAGADSLREGGFYIERSLAATSDIRQGPLGALLSERPGLLILDDVGTLRREDRRVLEDFVRTGGVLVRFAGPNLLAAGSGRLDPLMPAPLLGGERALGGALTWAQPQLVAQIDPDSPLAGLQLNEDIAVRKQVLTQPSADAETWVSLADGTPMVTAARRDEGLVVLIHVTAVPTWSDFPVSGLFASIMQRLSALAETDLNVDTTAAGEPLPAVRLLDGRGRLIEPPADSPPLVIGEPAAPGLYGEGASEVAAQAFSGDRLRPMTPSDLPRGARLIGPQAQGVSDLTPWFIGLALLLLAIDAIISMGSLPFLPAATAALAAIALVSPSDAEAQLRPPLTRQSKDAALSLRFAYVKTGDAALDRLSEAGLFGLTTEATRRSALEPGTPQGVDLDRDELSVYALLYWPVRPNQPTPSDAALQRIEAYMDGGGMLIIDTGDGSSPARSQVLRDVLGRLDAPPLQPLGEDHVLLFSFYKLNDLPGRNSGGDVWVETKGALDQRRDGVPSLIVSGRDWASAWALDANGAPLRPAGPGGEVRREYAFRAGINMAMVAITGNYKADQADVQTLLDRLGETSQ
ncbi:MAG: DUF4159 domain-containing protein [Parvularculaceae bacterium]|nr:DUF4159 domain-containing protein [Parvularculaceae bacterium]